MTLSSYITRLCQNRPLALLLIRFLILLLLIRLLSGLLSNLICFAPFPFLRCPLSRSPSIVPPIRSTVVLCPSWDHALTAVATIVKMLCKKGQARIRFCAGPTLTPAAVPSPVVQNVVPLALERNSVSGKLLKMVLETFERGEQLITFATFWTQLVRLSCVHVGIYLRAPFGLRIPLRAKVLSPSTRLFFARSIESPTPGQACCLEPTVSPPTMATPLCPLQPQFNVLIVEVLY